MTPRVQLGLVGALIVALAAVCFADTQERVAPPEDQSAYHLSVVGIVNNAEYRQLLSWFDNDPDLAALRKTTHFHAVKAGSAIYDARYRPNISGLPTVRLQDAKGVVLCELAGSAIPKSPAALLNAIEAKTTQILNRPILPWRKKIENNCDNGQCGPDGCPQQQMEFTPEELPLFEEELLPLPPVEPEPQGLPAWLTVVLVLVAAGGGAAGGVISCMKKEWA